MKKILENIERIDKATFIKTNKYKDVNIYFSFVLPSTRKYRAAVKILSSLLFQISEKYNTKKKMSDIKDMLYSLESNGIASKYQGAVLLNAHFSFVNPKFINDVSEKDYIDFIDEILKHPYFDEKIFEEIKRITIDTIKRKLENPTIQVINSLYEELAKRDDVFEHCVFNLCSDYEQLTIDDIKEVYNHLFDCVHIYCIGDFSDDLKGYLLSYKSKADIRAYSKVSNLATMEDIEIEKDINQSTLIVSYTTNSLNYRDSYYPLIVGNALLGGIPNSLLYTDIREKMSLCYSIMSSCLKSEGLLYIVTEIDKKNYEKTIKAINKQIRRMKLGLFSGKDLLSTKIQLVNSLGGLSDNPYEFVVFDMILKLYSINPDINEHIKNIMAVSKMDIIKEFRRLKKCLVYYLKGINDGKNI